MLKKDQETLLLVGYSESDETVVKKLTGPLASQWRVVRIGPSAIGELSIQTSATQALPLLLDEVAPYPEIEGWKYVSFENKHTGLGSALEGHGLTATDVFDCPRLPEVNRVIQKLEVTRNAIIVGQSGCGKSLMAYQAALHFHENDWEVIRLVDRQRTTDQLISSVHQVRHKTLLLLDDAHLLDSAGLDSFFECVSDKIAVLAISTDESGKSNDSRQVYISGKQAVDSIAKEYLVHQDQLLSLIKKFNNNVGNRWGQRPLSHLIEEARRLAKRPWEFNFVLTKGWERVSEQLNLLKEQDRADILWFLIALGQIVTTDAGLRKEELESLATTLECDKVWFQKSLKYLESHKLILITDQVKCLHLQQANTIFETLAFDFDDPKYQLVSSAIRLALKSDIGSLRGVSWLLNRFNFSGKNWWLLKEHIAEGDIWQVLFEKCWKAKSEEQQRDAAYALLALKDWTQTFESEVERNKDFLALWMQDATPTNAYAFGNLINGIYNENKKLALAICEQIDPQEIANKVNNTLAANASVWGYYISRLMLAPKWSKSFRPLLNLEALVNVFELAREEDLYSIGELAKSLYYLYYPHGDESLVVVEAAIPLIANNINKSPLEGIREAQDIIWFTLGFFPLSFSPKKLTTRQLQVSKQIAERLDTKVLAKAVSNSEPWEWQAVEELMLFLYYASRDVAFSVTDQVDLNTFDDKTIDMWGKIDTELMRLLIALSARKNQRLLHNWISKHSSKIAKVNSYLIWVAPNIVIERLQAGCTLDLETLEWDHNVRLLNQVAKKDKQLSIKILQDNRALLIKCLNELIPNQHEKLPKFIDYLETFAKEELKAILEGIEPS